MSKRSPPSASSRAARSTSYARAVTRAGPRTFARALDGEVDRAVTTGEAGDGSTRPQERPDPYPRDPHRLVERGVEEGASRHADHLVRAPRLVADRAIYPDGVSRSRAVSEPPRG